MAAIIARLTAANRRRKKQQKENPGFEADKCVYSLPPFDPCFNPMKHNKYLKNKNEFERRQLVKQKAKGTMITKNNTVFSGPTGLCQLCDIVNIVMPYSSHCTLFLVSINIKAP